MLFLSKVVLPRCDVGNCVNRFNCPALAEHSIVETTIHEGPRKRFWKVHDSGDLLPGYMYLPEPFFIARFPALEGVL